MRDCADDRRTELVNSCRGLGRLLIGEGFSRGERY